MTLPTLHSPLGASGASRWMNCPGSVYYSEGIQEDQSDFAREGTIAHALAAYCLETGDEAWMHIGDHMSLFEDYDIDAEMATAVQTYVNYINDAFEDRNQGNTWIERSFHCPSIHDKFYGTADFVHWDEAQEHVYVLDYKHGAGVVVDAVENPQCMYYAAGVLEDLNLWGEVDSVTVGIAQPRGFHYAGPIRTWTISTRDLAEWLENKLVPAMDEAMVSRDTTPGDWCQFCPVRKYACPGLVNAMAELEKMMTEFEGKNVDELDNDQISEFLELANIAKRVAKEAEQTAYARIKAGKEVPGFKLVRGRANRRWMAGAEGAIEDTFGDKAFERNVMSPAKLEKLVGGKDFAQQWAEKPQADYVLAPESDKRSGVSFDNKNLFTE